MRLVCLSLVLTLLPGISAGQPVADTVFTWQGYNRTAHCRVQLYTAPPGEDRTHTFVLQELAENRGPSTLDDARYLAELVGRQLGVDPAAAHWVFHWGAFSFAGADPDGRKELFLRATFRRTRSGSLTSPSWRLLTREEVEDYTDRQFR